MHRKSKDRYLTGDGVTRSLGADLTTKIMGQVLRAVFELNGVRRAPGLAGHLKRYKVTAENTLRYEYLDADYLPTAWPNTMILQVSNSVRRVCLFVNLVSSGYHSMTQLLHESTRLIRRLQCNFTPEFLSHILLVLTYSIINAWTIHHHTLPANFLLFPTHCTTMTFVVGFRPLLLLFYLQVILAFPARGRYLTRLGRGFYSSHQN